MKTVKSTLVVGDVPERTSPMPIFLLDAIYVAIGAAAFAITALYLGACDSL